MEDPDEIQFQTAFSKMVNDMVESLSIALEKLASDNGDNIEIKEEWKSDVKYITKQLIPHKHPMVSFMLINILILIIMNAYQESVMAGSFDMSDFETLHGQFSEEDASTRAVDALQKRQQKYTDKYKDIKAGDQNIKVADLGDVMKGQSLN